MFNEDFLMRQIEGMSRGLAKIIFNKEIASVEVIREDGVIYTEDFLLHKLLLMAEKGEINKAENLLFEELNTNTSEAIIKTAFLFYDKLATYSDEFLASGNYSREEILDGMTEIQRLCG